MDNFNFHQDKICAPPETTTKILHNNSLQDIVHRIIKDCDL